MKKTLCKPCAVEIAARKDREVQQLPGRSEKITCDKCGRRRFGLPYEVKRKFFAGGGTKKGARGKRKNTAGQWSSTKVWRQTWTT